MSSSISGVYTLLVGEGAVIRADPAFPFAFFLYLLVCWLQTACPVINVSNAQRYLNRSSDSLR